MVDGGVAGDLVEPRPEVAAREAARQAMPDMLPDDLVHSLGVGWRDDASRQKRKQRPGVPVVKDLHRGVGRVHRLDRLGTTGDDRGQFFVAGIGKDLGHNPEFGAEGCADQGDAGPPGAARGAGGWQASLSAARSSHSLFLVEDLDLEIEVALVTLGQ